MPELPDVEIFRRYLTRHARKQSIDKTKVPCPELLESINAGGLGRQLRGHFIRKSHRHGKHLIAELDSGAALVMHFGMTGYLVYSKSTQQAPDHICLTLHFNSNRNLYYISKRKLGHIAYASDPAVYVRDKGLGPDARLLDADGFAAAVADGHGTIKGRLMDQSRLAGLGNVYTDELLFQAQIHPGTPVETLDSNRLNELYEAMCHVLDKAIEANAQPQRMPDHFLLPNRKPGTPCPRCGTKVVKTKVAGRSGYMCPGCQPEPAKS